MTADHPSPTPEGRRCPECGGSGVVLAGFCVKCDGSGLVPTPAPEGGVPEAEEPTACISCGTDGFLVRASDTGRFVCTLCGDAFSAEEAAPTPTSAVGGEAIVVNLNPPRRTTCANCEADTPCEQGLPKNDAGEFVENDYEGEWVGVPACRRCFEAHARGGVAALAVIREGRSPTPAATGEEEPTRWEVERLADELSCSDAPIKNQAARMLLDLRRQRDRLRRQLADETAAGYKAVHNLSRQLAEAEEHITALASTNGDIAREYRGRWQEAEARATTAERRLEEKDAELAETRRARAALWARLEGLAWVEREEITEADVRLLRQANGDFAHQLHEIDDVLLADECCGANTARNLGEPDPDLGQYVCMNEDGDAIVDAETPADAIRQILDCWASVDDRLTASQQEVARLTEELRARTSAHERTYQAWESERDEKDRTIARQRSALEKASKVAKIARVVCESAYRQMGHDAAHIERVPLMQDLANIAALSTPQQTVAR